MSNFGFNDYLRNFQYEFSSMQFFRIKFHCYEYLSDFVNFALTFKVFFVVIEFIDVLSCIT